MRATFSWVTTRRNRGYVIWPIVGIAAGAIGEIAELGVPAPHLLGPLLLGLVIALGTTKIQPVPAVIHRGAQGLLGVLMGSYLNPAALRHSASSVIPLLVVTASTVALGLVAARVLTRHTDLNHASATLGMMAGGSTAVVATARELGADPKSVALMQYLRVTLVAASAPFLIGWLFASDVPNHHTVNGESAGWDLVTGRHQLMGLLLLIMITIAGMGLGAKLRLPSPFLVGPMIVTVTVTLTGSATGFTPTGPLQALLFTVVGLDVGLRFSRPDLAGLRRILPLVAASVFAMCAACALLAWALSVLAHIPLADAYLATTPGGINAVLATAVSTGANVGLISSVQTLRLFTMIAFAPILIRVAGLGPNIRCTER